MKKTVCLEHRCCCSACKPCCSENRMLFLEKRLHCVERAICCIRHKLEKSSMPTLKGLETRMKRLLELCKTADTPETQCSCLSCNTKPNHELASEDKFDQHLQSNFEKTHLKPDDICKNGVLKDLNSKISSESKSSEAEGKKYFPRKSTNLHLDTNNEREQIAVESDPLNIYSAHNNLSKEQTCNILEQISHTLDEIDCWQKQQTVTTNKSQDAEHARKRGTLPCSTADEPNDVIIQQIKDICQLLADSQHNIAN
jgi:hypothetical protein